MILQKFRSVHFLNKLGSRRFLCTKKPKKVLHITARHSNDSVVSIVTNDLLSKLNFEYNVKERDLWKEPMIPYKMDHVMAKFNIMKGHGTAQDHETFEPIKTLASELNETDLLILSTPLWNMSIPYVMKQYVDIVIQPGLNFMETKDWPAKITPVTKDKSIVVIYSCGAEVGQDALPVDYLGDYIRDVFGLVGFSDFHALRMTGVMSSSRDSQLVQAGQVNSSIAQQLNKKFT